MSFDSAVMGFCLFLFSVLVSLYVLAIVYLDIDEPVQKPKIKIEVKAKELVPASPAKLRFKKPINL